MKTYCIMNPLRGIKENKNSYDRVGRGGHPPFPLTPPGIRIRTRRFQKRSVHLETITDSTETRPSDANNLLLRVRTT
jgi:hypothetical protein